MARNKASVRCFPQRFEKGHEADGWRCRSPKPWHKQYVGRSPPTYAPPSLRPPPLGPPSFPPPATHLAADANPFAQRLPFPSKTASGIYHVPVGAKAIPGLWNVLRLKTSSARRSRRPASILPYLQERFLNCCLCHRRRHCRPTSPQLRKAGSRPWP